MKHDINNYIGLVFNDLRIIGPDNSNQHFNSNRWLVECKCGKVFSELPSRVLSGHKKSCGCRSIESRYSHGYAKNEFYHTWWSMMQRCYNKAHHNYPRYGARGITVCQEWQTPEGFIEWALSTARKKSPELTLDRIDNNLGYSPDNCRWVSMKTQSNNRRTNSYETIDGVTRTLAEWCNIYNIRGETVRARQKRGMSFKEALTTPVANSKFQSKAPTK